MSKVCNNCNAILNENNKFCTQCGTKVQIEESYQEKKDYSSQSTINSTLTKKNKLFSSRIIDILVLIVFILIYLTNRTSFIVLDNSYLSILIVFILVFFTYRIFNFYNER